MITAEKTCLECKETKPLAFFYLKPETDGDYLNICVVCVEGYRALKKRPRKVRKKGNQSRLLPRKMDEKCFPDYLMAVLDVQTKSAQEKALAEMPEEFRDLTDKWLTFLGRKHDFKNQNRRRKAAST
jgi:hypothetical protein